MPACFQLRSPEIIAWVSCYAQCVDTLASLLLQFLDFYLYPVLGKEPGFSTS